MEHLGCIFGENGDQFGAIWFEPIELNKNHHKLLMFPVFSETQMFYYFLNLYGGFFQYKTAQWRLRRQHVPVQLSV